MFSIIPDLSIHPQTIQLIEIGDHIVLPGTPSVGTGFIHDSAHFLIEFPGFGVFPETPDDHPFLACCSEKIHGVIEKSPSYSAFSFAVSDIDGNDLTI